RDTAVPHPSSNGQAALELAITLIPVGLLATLAIGGYIGGYAGSLELAAWALGSFAAGFAAIAVAGIAAALLDDDTGRATLVGPLAASAVALAAIAGLFGLASNLAGEGPWAAASLVAPAAGGAALAGLLAAALPSQHGRAAAGPAAGAIAATAAVAGLLAGGYGAAVTDDAAWSAYPLVVLACALVAASVAIVPGTVMAATRRSSAPPIAAGLAALVVVLAAIGAAFVLLPEGRGPAAGAAGTGSGLGLLLAHLGFLPGTTSTRPVGRIAPWLLAALAVIVAWLLGSQLTEAGFPEPAGGFTGVALALAAALGPVLARASLQPFPSLPPGTPPAIEAWAPPEATPPPPEPPPAAPTPLPARSPASALTGLGALAAVALFLAIAAHARYHLLAVAEADPVAYAAIVQDLGLVPAGNASRYALANDTEAHRQALEDLRTAIASDADFGPADLRFLLGADAAIAERFASERLAAGALIPGEAQAIRAARTPLPALLPLPGATAGAALGVLLALAVLAASRLPAGGSRWHVLALAAGTFALLLGCAPALRFWGPSQADAITFLAAFALAGGVAAQLQDNPERPGASAALGLAMAGSALALLGGTLT
ncbi:hypothetical protein, partial [Tepidiforma sp.]|uniref:hypothetical protein n=1 Tax=Tepidiforma sp. TaxID=2682230 RepID=UPI002ADE7B6E